jgi:hypothetical protein
MAVGEERTDLNVSAMQPTADGRVATINEQIIEAKPFLFIIVVRPTARPAFEAPRKLQHCRAPIAFLAACDVDRSPVASTG